METCCILSDFGGVAQDSCKYVTFWMRGSAGSRFGTEMNLMCASSKGARLWFRGVDSLKTHGAVCRNLIHVKNEVEMHCNVFGAASGQNCTVHLYSTLASYSN